MVGLYNCKLTSKIAYESKRMILFIKAAARGVAMWPESDISIHSFVGALLFGSLQTNTANISSAVFKVTVARELVNRSWPG